MMDKVHQDRAPQYVPNRHSPIGKLYLTVELCLGEIREPGDCLLMHTPVPRRKLRHLTRTLEVGRRVLEGHRSLDDPIADVALDLAQMPGQLAERPATGIGSEVVLIGRERFEQLGSKVSFHIPDRAKPFEFVNRGHEYPPASLQTFR